MLTEKQMNRREFLRQGAATTASLTIAFYLPPFLSQAAERLGQPLPSFEPNAFLTVHPNNTVTITVKHLEMGQGVYTGLPMLVAEELEVYWQQIRVQSAPADEKLYNNLLWGTSQGTGGSTSTANSYDQLRQAGATAREMLIAAAAIKWKTDGGSIYAKNGRVIHKKSGKSFSYGQLVEAASKLTAPKGIKLKDPNQFNVIGKSWGRIDGADKTNGKAKFGIDVHRPGMLTALLQRPPRFGGKVGGFNQAEVSKLPGVKAVVAVPQGVAVLADNFWNAKNAREALNVTWDESNAFKGSSDQLKKNYIDLLSKKGAVAQNDGNAEEVIAKSPTRLESQFEFPFLAHAPMEPLNCVIELGENGCEVWAGAQLQTADQAALARTLGLPKEKVQIHTMLAGGSFGRRGNPQSDYMVEAAEIAKAVSHLKAPIRLLWTREDDLKGGWYRPMYVHKISAGLNEKGEVTGWSQRIVGQSILEGTPWAAFMKNGIDRTSVEGAADLPYSIPNLYVDLHSTKVGVPVLWWRSVGSTHTAFSTEVFVDELATAAKADPFEFRRKMLKTHSRHLGVLELAAKKAKWGKPLSKGTGMGIAVHESFGSFVAQVAEVTVGKEGEFKVNQVVCAVDCGVAVNPDNIRAQMEGGIGFGLAAALHGEITIKEGLVQQESFGDYPVLRMNEMPNVEVHIVSSQEKPTGVGEPGVPVIAPAVSNALFAATGKRVRNLPIRL